MSITAKIYYSKTKKKKIKSDSAVESRKKRKKSPRATVFEAWIHVCSREALFTADNRGVGLEIHTNLSDLRSLAWKHVHQRTYVRCSFSLTGNVYPIYPCLSSSLGITREENLVGTCSTEAFIHVPRHCDASLKPRAGMYAHLCEYVVSFFFLFFFYCRWIQPVTLSQEIPVCLPGSRFGCFLFFFCTYTYFLLIKY